MALVALFFYFVCKGHKPSGIQWQNNNQQISGNEDNVGLSGEGSHFDVNDSAPIIQSQGKNLGLMNTSQVGMTVPAPVNPVTALMNQPYFPAAPAAVPVNQYQGRHSRSPSNLGSTSALYDVPGYAYDPEIGAGAGAAAGRGVMFTGEYAQPLQQTSLQLPRMRRKLD